MGSQLRAQALDVARLAQRAWRDKRHQAAHVGQLVWAVDELKLSLQLAKTVQAFVSFSQFEACATLAVQLGKQSGGWHRQLVISQSASASRQAANRQNPTEAEATPHGAAARPDSLSPQGTTNQSTHWHEVKT